MTDQAVALYANAAVVLRPLTKREREYLCSQLVDPFTAHHDAPDQRLCAAVLTSWAKVAAQREMPNVRSELDWWYGDPA